MTNLRDRLRGSITALATPFRDGAVDEKAYAHFVDWQIEQGSHGLVVCGTTGESPTLSDAEQDRLISITVQVAGGRVPVLAGTGSNDTRHAIHRTQQAARLGADGALIVSPYYNKPTQEGLYQHFKAIHDANDRASDGANQIPIVLYNIPGRCVVDILPPTMQRLAALPRIIGVKDATGDLTRPVRTRLDCGENFVQLCGDDGNAAAFLAQGGVGCISVASNVAPRLCAALQEAWMKQDLQDFVRFRDQLMPLIQSLFVETSPSPLKYAMSLMGLSTDEVRLPLVTCQPATKAQVAEAMQKLGLAAAKAA